MWHNALQKTFQDDDLSGTYKTLMKIWSSLDMRKDLSLCHKLKFSNPYILMVQTFDISNLDYLIYQNS